MNKIRAFLVGTVIVATTLVATPLAAVAEPALSASLDAPAAESAPPVPADGLLHVYHGFSRTNYCDSWLSHSAHWGVCRNSTASLWNNGYPGNLDDVLVFWAPDYAGSYRGIHNGVVLDDLRQWTFDDTGLPGSNEWLYNNISSHKWVNL